MPDFRRQFETCRGMDHALRHNENCAPGVNSIDSNGSALKIPGPLKLLIVHYHFRAGGIRRVIELGARGIVDQAPAPITEIILASGEAPPEEWIGELRAGLSAISVTSFTEPVFRYISEQRSPIALIRRQITARVAKLLDDVGSGVVWAHNFAVGRNLLLAQALAKNCERRRLPFISHQHDWWFDHRWLRWPEIRRSGFATLSAAAKAVFPPRGHVHQVAINRQDARILQRHYGPNASWLPNPTTAAGAVPAGRIRQARSWLRQNWNVAGPFWIVPCRLLRRKNLAEALLLTRWLNPKATLITTGGPSSADELDYQEALSSAAQKHSWPLRLGVLREDSPGQPGVAELVAASQAVLLTSLQEGFGLPYLEATALGRPLVARALSNITPDLGHLGYSFPQLYEEVWITRDLFDWAAERKRQQDRFAEWRRQLPTRIRSWAESPPLLSSPGTAPVPFSRLTLIAQLEVLSVPGATSWSACRMLNPQLEQWRSLAAHGNLEVASSPDEASHSLHSGDYGGQFWKMVQSTRRNAASAINPTRVQDDFIRQRLGRDHLYPLLWSARP
jgi:hypothetical protein